MSCPLRVTFWHEEQVVEIFWGRRWASKGHIFKVQGSSSIQSYQVINKSSITIKPYPSKCDIMPQKREIRPPKENVGVGKASESPPRDAQVTPKKRSLIQSIQRRGGASSNLWASCPYEGLSKLVPPWKNFHLARTDKKKQIHPPRIYKSQVSCQVSHI